MDGLPTCTKHILKAVSSVWQARKRLDSGQSPKGRSPCPVNFYQAAMEAEQLITLSVHANSNFLTSGRRPWSSGGMSFVGIEISLQEALAWECDVPCGIAEAGKECRWELSLAAVNP
eukprot:75538-Pelagomonas_calceolata.AAC.1